MSLILEGVDLPKGGEKLKIEIEPDGNVWIDQGSEWEKHEGAAVQILRPHGRVIDIGEYKRESGMQDGTCNGCVNFEKCDIYQYSKMDICEWLDDAPTILEAEEENG